MAFTGFPPDAIRFLADLRDHNEKSWFDANRSRWDDACVAPARAFVEDFGARLRAIEPGLHGEPKVGGSILRINRDTRFSADKRPYKDHLDLFFWKGDAKGWDRPGVFLRLQPDDEGLPKLIVGVGMHGFADETLAKYRAAVADPVTGAALEAAVAEVTARGGHTVGGEHYKRVPKGFDADHPRARWLKHSGLHAGWEGPAPASLESAKFLDFCEGVARDAMPVLRWIDRALATG
jgi:uncharacterized protein (TIGR02453 family)